MSQFTSVRSLRFGQARGGWAARGQWNSPGQNKELCRQVWGMLQPQSLVRARPVRRSRRLAACCYAGTVLNGDVLIAISHPYFSYPIIYRPPFGHRHTARRQSRSLVSTDRTRPCFMAAFAPTRRRIPCNLGLGALQGRRIQYTSISILFSVRAALISTSTVTPQAKPNSSTAHVRYMFGR